MAAFAVSEVEVLDAEQFEKYRTLAAESIAKYGGRYLVRGAEAQVAEGAPISRRIVIVEFESMDVLKRWYRSTEYPVALQTCSEALDRRLMFVEGVG
jgi:uncharacterized protein (DUF1330 family)